METVGFVIWSQVNAGRITQGLMLGRYLLRLLARLDRRLFGITERFLAGVMGIFGRDILPREKSRMHELRPEVFSEDFSTLICRMFECRVYEIQL